MVRSSVDVWERRMMMCRNAVMRYRHWYCLNLCAADVDDITSEVICDIAAKVQSGKWRFVSTPLLHKRVLGALRKEKRRRDRASKMADAVRKCERLMTVSEKDKALEYAYWPGMGTSDEDIAHEKLLALPYALEPTIGAVTAVGLSSGLNLRSRESHQWLADIFGHTESTVRKYIGEARRTWKLAVRDDDVDWAELVDAMRRIEESKLPFGFRSVLLRDIDGTLDIDAFLSWGRPEQDRMLAMMRGARYEDEVVTVSVLLCYHDLLKGYAKRAVALVSEADAIVAGGRCSEKTIDRMRDVRKDVSAHLSCEQ